MLIFEDMLLRILITVINAAAMLTLLLAVNIFSSCNEDKDSSVIETSFNYWKTVFKLTDFKSNKYFPQFIKEYGNTPFYKQAFNSCSYLGIL